MKYIPFARYGNYEARAFLLAILQTCPQGQNLGQMRSRLKVLQKLEASNSTGVTLEDAEHQTLVDMLNQRSDFVVTSADIVAIIDAVMEAKEPLKVIDGGMESMTREAS